MKLRFAIVAVLAVILCSCGTESPPAVATLKPGGPTATVVSTVIKMMPTIVPATEMPEVVSGSVTARSLNVRSGPGTDHPVIGGLSYGDEVTVVGRNAEETWLQIVYESEKAWVSAAYVDLEGEE